MFEKYEQKELLKIIFAYELFNNFLLVCIDCQLLLCINIIAAIEI